MQQLTESIRSLTATVLATLGMLVVVSLSVIPLVNLVPAGFLQVFALPGRFLFASFHAAAAYIPVYLIVAAAMVRRGSGASAILALNLSILPFLTLAVALRLAFDARVSASPVTAGVEQMLGLVPGAAAFALLTALLSALVVAVWYMWSRVDGDRHDAGFGRRDSEVDGSREVLELPAPAAAFAWRYTPRGKARAAAQAADEAGGGDTSGGEVAADDAPAEDPSAADAPAGGTPVDDGSAEEDDSELEDIPPVVRPRESAASDDDGVGLQIAWPAGRSRVQFDDDPAVDYYAEQEERQQQQEAEAMRQSPEERQSAQFSQSAASSADVRDPLIVEFRDGRFRSVDAEGDEVLLGFSAEEGTAEEATAEEGSRESQNEVPADMMPIEELEAVDEDEPWSAEAGEAPRYESQGQHYTAEDYTGDDYPDDYDAEEYYEDATWDDDYDEDDEYLEETAERSTDESMDEPDEEPAGVEVVDESDELQHEQSQPEQSQPEAPARTSRKKSGRSRKPRYNVPIEGLLHEYPNEHYWELDERTKSDGETLRYTLQEFGIEAEVTGIRKGPVITMYEILPAPGVKLTKIVNLADNIALRLAAQTVRIVAPIPGKHAVGIEVPNKRRSIVSFADLVQQPAFNDKEQSIPMAIGKDIPGDAQIIDLAKTPHLLIAGATGSGKSVCVNSIICSILYRRPPEDVKMILIDPKIVELKFYNDIPHLLTPVITEPKRAFQALQWALYEMERRYSLLDSLQVRDIKSYNQKVKARKLATETLPYLVIVVDEFADLMATSGKELESTLARLAAMSRAVGIHLVLATQRPSTDVITGLIKANIPSRIAFMVASKVDSRIILDSQGAEKLLGRGDMLFTSAWDPAPIRMQGAFLSEDEVERVVNHVKTLGEPEYIDDEIFIDEDEDPDMQEDLEDPLLEKAISVVQQSRKASASYLQRRLKIGYNRAARMVEEMERLGIVGPANGSKPREILRNEAVGVGE